MSKPIHIGGAIVNDQQRRAGILLHPTSLPAGNLGADAYRFVDFLAASGMTLWQVLPLGPTHQDLSPYQGLSVHAGNPDLIDLQDLAGRGWLPPEEIENDELSHSRRQALLQQALGEFRAKANEAEQRDYADFIARHADWLEDYALFQALKREYSDCSWTDWPQALRDREPSALLLAKKRHADHYEQGLFEQFLFFQQWGRLRDYANDRGVMLIGDLPIFVAHDSADVWAQRHYFLLDESGQPQVVAGVPPDYFSEFGQRWGNPLYDWSRLAADEYGWWLERLKTQLTLFDCVRIDHFRGFEAYWEIPVTEETAVNGRWIPGPGEDFFQVLQRVMGDKLPLVAEDLGLITEEVRQLREQFGLPGMKILQFAFDGGAENPYLPHNHEVNSLVYTGTHDNNTTLGWYHGLSPEQQESVYTYFGHPAEPMPWMLIRQAYASVSKWAIVPLQDVLELDEAHRMNIPGTQQDNWCWQFQWLQFPPGLEARLKNLAVCYSRL